MCCVERHGLWSDEQKEAASRLSRIVEEKTLEVIRLSLPDQLGILRGKVVRFNLPHDMKVPHMGWNRGQFLCDAPVLRGLASGTYFYFVHSYYATFKSSSSDRDFRQRL